MSTWVFRTFIIPVAQGAKAVAICDALGYPDKGMFVSQVENGTVYGYISSGWVSPTSPILGTAADLFAACKGAAGITLSDCQAFLASLDLTQADPIPHKDAILRECTGTEVTPAWVQPTGSQDAYPFDAAVSHAGKKWRNLTNANVWEPGVSGWREFWTTGYPAWIQPTGAHDAYAVGARVRHLNKNWQSNTAANVWEPGVFGWVEIV